MKKLILIFLMIPFVGSAFAANDTLVSIHITNPAKSNKYFFCIYNVGCISIKNAKKGKTFPIQPMDVGNIINFVVTDLPKNHAYMQGTSKSCDVKLKKGQKLTITGNLVVKNTKPVVKNLRCHVA